MQGGLRFQGLPIVVLEAYEHLTFMQVMMLLTKFEIVIRLKERPYRLWVFDDQECQFIGLCVQLVISEFVAYRGQMKYTYRWMDFHRCDVNIAALN